MYEKLEKFMKPKVFLAFALFILLVLSYFFIQDQLFPDYKQMKALSKEVTKINDSLKDSINGNTIDTETSISLLTDNLDKLLKAKNKLDTISPSKRYISTYKNFMLGISNNLRLYEQTLAIIKSPTSKDIATSLENINKYEKDCLKYYSLCKKDNLPLVQSQNFTKFFSNVSFYINQIIKLNRDSDIKNDQKNDFLIALDECINKFVPLIEDLSPAIERTLNEKRSFVTIIDDVNSKSVIFEDLKKSFYAISVPADAIECFSDFEDTLKIYNLYITSLINIVKDNPNSLEDFDDTFSKYKDLKLTIEKFEASYSKYRNND
ncbi:hypothetical protein CPJCM30710_26080 [Clostridium polyendosporum]|uniref:Uncharacterized protein n=1 Tax=Clostridium polyendosporum TaxID=69208 RepID=A0A919VH70_9CLOT|nr:hypothetical protein [Clostridium polyendosporum]GIM29942.1 hypothetical protein CPJCM30710_26080 [Clostridium polyendosporum]